MDNELNNNSQNPPEQPSPLQPQAVTPPPPTAGGFPPPPQGQPGGYAPPPPGYQHPRPTSYPGKGMSIAALVLGICSLVIPYAGIATAIVGLILGVIGKRKANEVGASTGMATAGIVMSIIALVGAVLMTVCFIAICNAAIAMDYTDIWWY